MQSVYAKYMGDSIFKILTAAVLSKIVDGIDKLELAEVINKNLRRLIDELDK